MSYVELDNVMFRGTLKGATGKAKFKLTAQAINAVDSVNINYDQVTYNKLFTYERASQSSGSTLVTASLQIPDAQAWVEIIAYGDRAAYVTIDGARRLNRNRRGPGSKFLPYVEMVSLTKGTHTVRLVSGSSGYSKGLILCRYIRKTGG